MNNIKVKRQKIFLIFEELVNSKFGINKLKYLIYKSLDFNEIKYYINLKNVGFEIKIISVVSYQLSTIISHFCSKIKLWLNQTPTLNTRFK